MQATSEQFVSDSWETLIYITSVFLKLILSFALCNKDILHVLGYNYNLLMFLSFMMVLVNLEVALFSMLTAYMLALVLGNIIYISPSLNITIVWKIISIKLIYTFQYKFIPYTVV